MSKNSYDLLASLTTLAQRLIDERPTDEPTPTPTPSAAVDEQILLDLERVLVGLDAVNQRLDAMDTSLDALNQALVQQGQVKTDLEEIKAALEIIVSGITEPAPSPAPAPVPDERYRVLCPEDPPTPAPTATTCAATGCKSAASMVMPVKGVGSAVPLCDVHGKMLAAQSFRKPAQALRNPPQAEPVHAPRPPKAPVERTVVAPMDKSMCTTECEDTLHVHSVTEDEDSDAASIAALEAAYEAAKPHLPQDLQEALEDEKPVDMEVLKPEPLNDLTAMIEASFRAGGPRAGS